ncbi:negative elongation factor E [Chironomus tepperi]|uniref:negative elongation factor E n=1 Tax=Chironomus tepperi TaxID=113505 RepID=UPI00391F2345
MVFHIPEALTEEEQMLMAKYAKLKKKKKQVQALKIKPEPEKPLLPKRPKDAKDAKEVARKLIKSGNINLPKNDTQNEVKFKRPNFSQERKKAQNMETTSYHPYSSTSEEETASKSPLPGIEKTEQPNGNRSISFLYQQITQEKEPVEPKKHSPQQKDKPKSGFTVYVSGKSITEDFLKKHFSEYGTIVNVSMEIEKGRGFITFSKTEATSQAISEMHGKLIEGIQLTVSLARKQPQIEPINDASSSAVWSTLATSQSQKGNHKDKRELVVYDDVFA